MSVRALSCIAPGLVVVLGLCNPSLAGFPWLFGSQHASSAAPRNDCNGDCVPATQGYVVVAPTPATGGCPGDCRWKANRSPVPMYPWGWFGACSAPQGWTHTGYYGEYRDHAILRAE